MLISSAMFIGGLQVFYCILNCGRLVLKTLITIVIKIYRSTERCVPFILLSSLMVRI